VAYFVKKPHLPLKLSYTPYLLQLKHPFGVSSNTRTHTPTVFVRLEHEGFYGFGEACLPAYLGENTEDTLGFLAKAKAVLESMRDFSQAEIRAKIEYISEANNAAKAAIDVAVQDVAGKMAGKTFWQMMALQKPEPRLTSCTIGIDSADVLEKKIEEAKDFKILKIKAGTRDDRKLIKTIRLFTDKPLYVDVNQGWQDVHYVNEMLGWMKEQNVLLVEQPMPVEMLDEMVRVTEKSPLPVIADESVKRLKDIHKVKHAFSGINIKLMKSGGLVEALEMCRLAKKSGLKIMLGCMAESSCATTAIAQLMSLADFIDLDAPNLIVNDPFEGVKYAEGKVFLNDEPGTGVKLKMDLQFTD
jgi:L-alanine-DL-glutamate epimerase-like enolase superfamily enzyme